jgi:hypothetical protein
MSAVPRKEGFTQVVVWPATVVGAHVAEFEGWMAENFEVRAQYLEEVTTGPDYNDPTSGGRIDTVFAIHQDDIGKFAVPRLSAGMRWIEDVLDNEARQNMEAQPATPFHSIYPTHLEEYRTW